MARTAAGLKTARGKERDQIAVTSGCSVTDKRGITGDPTPLSDWITGPRDCSDIQHHSEMNDDADARELYEERAAIMEYDGGLPRYDADTDHSMNGKPAARQTRIGQGRPERFARGMGQRRRAATAPIGYFRLASSRQ